MPKSPYLRFLLFLFASGQPAITFSQTIFEPSISVFGGRTSNVGITSGEEDDYLNFGLSLPVTRRTSQSDLEFSLAADARRYDVNDVLDSESYFLSSRYRRRQTARNSFELSINAERTQQRDLLPTSGTALALRPRLEESRYGLTFSDTLRIGQRLTFEASAGHQIRQFDRLSDSDLPDFENEDRSGSFLEIDLMRSMSATLDLGPRYRYRRFDFESRENIASQGLALAMAAGRADRDRFEIEVGGYQIDGGSEDGRGGFEGSIVWYRTRGKNRFSTSLSQSLNAEDPFLGVVETQEALTSWGLSVGKMDLDIGAAYSQQDPLRLESLADSETLTGGLSLGLAISPLFAILARATYAEDLTGVFDRSDFWEASIGFSWYPLKNTRLGSLGRVRRDPTSTGIGKSR